MKKSIMALGAAILVAGAITFGSCEKQAKDLPADNLGTPGAAKETTNRSMFNDAMDRFWFQCDSAYQADSALFIRACNMEDEEAFLSITHISTSTISTIDSLAIVSLQGFMTEYPGYFTDTNSICNSCHEHALENICESIRTIRYYLDLVEEDGPTPLTNSWYYDDYGVPELGRCILRCCQGLPFGSLPWHFCIEGCYLTYQALAVYEMAITTE